MSVVPVIETFSSIQGESTHAGRRCFFIRLAGCNLQCNYCDTTYAWHGGVERQVDDLVSEAAASGMDVVEITGGEPLIHPALPLLVQALLDKALPVLVETNGSMDISILPRSCCRIVDCKTPGSGMADQNLWSNFSHLTPDDEVKFVVSSAADFEWSLEVIKKWKLAEKTRNLIFSPVWGRISFEELAALVMKSPLPVRMQLQMHKLIWGDKKGV